MEENQTYRIGEVAEMLELKTYVLRFWETEFPQLEPKRTESGQRFYSAEDVSLLRRIRQLLHEQGMTIEGARKILSLETGLDKNDRDSDAAMSEAEFMEMLDLELTSIGRLLERGAVM